MTKGGLRATAILAALLVPAGGHIILGRWRRGFVLAAAMALSLLSVRWTRIFGFMPIAALYLLLLIDAGIIEPRSERPPWPRVALLLVISVAAFIAVAGLERAFLVEAFTIPAGGMSPALLVGDRVFVDKMARSPTRGDVIVFEPPSDRTVDFVERVVAVAGDRVSVRKGRLVVNGTRLTIGAPAPCSFWDTEDRPGEGKWVQRRETCVEEGLGKRRWIVVHVPDAQGLADFPPTGDFIVPAATVFVLGDDRANSKDSRHFGPVPLGSVKGRVTRIWFSKGPADTIRWDRVDAIVH
jgi:signal peptidase I